MVRRLKKNIVEGMEKEIHSYSVDSRIGMDGRKWFPVNVGYKDGCVMFPFLFNVYMDGVVREVNGGVLWKGLELPHLNGGRFEKK